MRRWHWVAVLGLACVAVVVAMVFVSGGGRQGSTAAPPRDDTPIQVAQRPSTIVVPISASLMALQARLNAQVPNQLFAIDEARDQCLAPQYTQVCIGVTLGGACRGRSVRTQITPAIPCHIRGNVDRGPIQLSGAGATINVQVPVAVRAQVSGQGAVGRHIRETVTGSAVVDAALTPAIGPDWTPGGRLSLGYDWRNRIGIDVLGQRISLAASVDPMISQLFGRIAAQAPQALAEIRLRERMQQVWTQLAQPVQLSQDPASWLRFVPSAVGYSGLQVTDGTAATRVMISGVTATFVGGRPSAGDPGPLPPLRGGTAEPGFRLFVPVLADYRLMAETAEQALQVGTRQPFDIPVLGTGTVTFRDVEIYQTTDRRLAVGVTLSLDTVGTWGDVRGTVWLTARPVFDRATRTLSVDQVEVAADTNNAAADQLLRVINFGPVNQRVRAAVRYDLNEAWQQALARANAALNRDLGQGIRMRGAIRSARVAETSTAPAGFYLGLEAEGLVEVDIGSAPAR